MAHPPPPAASVGACRAAADTGSAASLSPTRRGPGQRDNRRGTTIETIQCRLLCPAIIADTVRFGIMRLSHILSGIGCWFEQQPRARSPGRRARPPDAAALLR
eukprot:761811-Hanusia_phi.AAC.1